MPDAECTSTLAPTFAVRNFASFSPTERARLAEQVTRLEKRVFPAIEHFNYGIELKKKNVGLIVAIKRSDPNRVVAYLVYQRMKRLAWLHKLCVVEQEREKGLGKRLILALCAQMRRGGCQSIHLWVDESREPARALYASCQFKQCERRQDYYSNGRSALRLVLEFGG